MEGVASGGNLQGSLSFVDPIPGQRFVQLYGYLAAGPWVVRGLWTLCDAGILYCTVLYCIAEMLEMLEAGDDVLVWSG